MPALAPRKGLLGVLVAPLVWLERARGWRRRFLLLLYLLAGLVVGMMVWWIVSLNRLPDIGEPFDLAEFASYEVPDAENAAVQYRQAISRLKKTPAAQDSGIMWKAAAEGWSEASPELRRWVDSNREAMALWRQGTERPRALVVSARDLGRDDSQAREFRQAMVLFHWLALLEASRLEDKGDLAGAWDWYNAALRASRHIGMHTDSSYRSLGSFLYRSATERIVPWTQDPRVEASTLRQALKDFRQIIAMTGTNSDAIKGDYISMMRTIEEPDQWMKDASDGMIIFLNERPALFRALRFWKREPERSRRIYRIIFAHWLAYADDPPQQRPTMAETQVVGNHTFPNFPYAVPPGATDKAHPITAEALYGWHQSSLNGGFFKNFGLCPPLVYRVASMDHDRNRQNILLLILAEQLYQREHGRPADAPSELVRAGYIDRLPDGYDDPDENRSD